MLAFISLKAQDICNPDGNVMIYSNYDGGYLTIDVDVDIPDLKIGIVSYHASDVTITGAFSANVTEVIYAGFDQIADGCPGTDILETIVTGVDPAIVTYHRAIDGDVAIASYLGDDLFGVPLANCMVAGSGCEETTSGGGNSSPQIVQFFLSEFEDDDVFYGHWTDSGCWPGSDFLISEGGNCCLEDPVTDPNPIYVEGADYDFFSVDTISLCTTDTVLDISYYPTLYADPEWSTGETGYSISVTEPGTYYFTMPDYCHYGSNLLTDTLVLEPCNTSIDTAICDGDTYILPDGSTTDIEGTYTFTFIAADGSDSIVVVNLSLIPIITTNVDASICAGGIYILPGGMFVFTEGVYTSTLVSVTGCDSIVITDLSVIDTVYGTLDDSFCPGGSYILPDGTEVTVAGTYDVELTSAAGCDSLLTITLSVSDTLEVLVAGSICAGDSYTLEDGTVVTEAGTYEAFLFPPDVACVTRYSTTLEVTDTVFGLLDASICPGGTYILPDGSEVSDPGIYTIDLTSAFGCDSVLEVNLTLSDTIEVFNEVSICAGDFYVLEDGSTAITGGTYVVVLSPPDVDCVTRYTTEISVEPFVSISIEAPANVCIEDGPILLNIEPTGGVYTGVGVSGNYFDPAIAGPGGPYSVLYTYTSPLGCVSATTRTFIVNENYAEAGEDIYIFIGESVTLNVFTDGNPSWSPSGNISCIECYNPVVSPATSTTYTVTSVDDQGCVATDEVTVFVEEEPDYVYYIPNAFTPNSDGSNDFLTAYGPDLNLIELMTIFDRWGNIIYSAASMDPNDSNNGWNGSRQGEPAQPGVYAYTMTLVFRGGYTQTVNGNITLLR